MCNTLLQSISPPINRWQGPQGHPCASLNVVLPFVLSHVTQDLAIQHSSQEPFDPHRSMIVSIFAQSIINMKNHVDALHDQEDLIWECNVGESSRQNDSASIHADPEPNSLDLNSEVKEAYVEFVTNVVKSKGASTPSSDGLDV
ncbi:hypothetical protein Tco_0803780 [Tanacetum coccineum]|uniref:Uncharacterized protein n=1 Tax=Tanacetum coccineum TaxID=301880 RepID=A0ABQ5A3I3_9ASTR